MASASRKKKGNPALKIILAAGIIIVLFVLFKVFGPNTGSFSQGDYLYIHTGSGYGQVKETLQKGGYVKDITSFDLLAKQAHYPEHIHPGKYKIERGMSNYNIVKMLHGGRQTEVKLVINKLRTKHDFITVLSTELEADSLVLKQMFSDPIYLAQFGLDTNTVMCAAFPDTYQFRWNTGADIAFKRIEKAYAHYWNDERKQEAKKHNLSPVQAMVVASIVDDETNKTEDKPKIASVYLNRLQKGMKLQADPTVKYAVGDFTIRRITGAHLQSNSPYNTYKYSGLPPGPICTPAQSSIEAVLHAANTNYLYFCAKEDFSGYSNFAATFDEQLRNARLYQQALNARGIH